MGAEFLDLVSRGKNQWWRYVLAFATICFFAFLIGALPLLSAAIFVIFDGNPNTNVNPATGMLVGVDSLLTFPLLMSSFVALLLGLALAVEGVHRRRMATLVTPGPRINWRRVAQGFGLWLLLTAALSALEAALYPGRYRWSLDPVRFLPFAAMAVWLVPLQTSSEELLFRGYGLQSLGRLTRNPLALGLISGLLFALPHAVNPEVASGFWPVMAFYFTFGAAMAWITLRDNSLELALGVHAANNLFAALLASYQGSAIEAPAVFTAAGFDPWYNLLGGLAALLIFYLIIFRPWQATILVPKPD